MTITFCGHSQFKSSTEYETKNFSAGFVRTLCVKTPLAIKKLLIRRVPRHLLPQEKAWKDVEL